MRITKPSTSGARVALYVRVSSEEQVQGYSLDAQTRAIEVWCAQHEHEIVARYRDEGRSARSDNLDRRPAFKQMLADAEAGRLDVVVVHKLDRFARNLLVALETLQRLERFDVGFVSLSEQMDFTTPIDKVILATLAAFAQYYSDNLSAETKKGKHERKEQGLYNGLLPFGLKKNSDGIPVPDPEAYPGLLLAFRLAAGARATGRSPQRSTPRATGPPATADVTRSPRTPSAACSRTASTSVSSLTATGAGCRGPTSRSSTTPSSTRRSERGWPTGRRPARAASPPIVAPTRSRAWGCAAAAAAGCMSRPTGTARPGSTATGGARARGASSARSISTGSRSNWRPT